MMTIEMGIIGSVIEALLDMHYKCSQWFKKCMYRLV